MNLVSAKVTGVVSYDMASYTTDFRTFSKVNFRNKMGLSKNLGVFEYKIWVKLLWKWSSYQMVSN